ncbi:cyclic nucleotide-binding protein [Methylobacterium sp. Leaf399]|uniref:patatin-like phospholipase family protein n=1 Tax=unclassified Methylobacterium TaxID=2615210 RepID=UPI0006FA9601|nr:MULTISPECIES: patatin-like phospholipase family protein [unclassified Methylobacterium]KQP50909.1 cyclic nucleotide-binding protein [Methylobacterium sp. Leaf108]KQT07894.1 cyclic nucleotide-binding protein [Methylobacterium sp. Leaf399]
MDEPDIPFLRYLDEDAAQAIRDRLASVAVAGGQVLFHEGDEADALYTLASGAIGISRRDPRTGAIRRVARLRPPITVGEMALLSEGPRSATATALRDSHLYRLSRRAFEDLVERHPSTMLYFTRLLADRLRRADEAPALDNAPRTFTVLPVTAGIDAGALAHGFAGALPGQVGYLDAWPEEADETWFHRFESGHDRVVYRADEPGSAWTRLCLRRSDHVLLLAAAGQPPKPACADFAARTPSDWVRHDLVVVQAPDAVLPRPAHRVFSGVPVSLRIHVRPGRADDLGRLARLASGCARAVVFGGGGARGFAHLGVIRALEEAGLPIDAVGGTSMGAIVAASLAMGWSGARILDQTVAAFVSRNPLNDYTLPILALTRGAKVDEGLARTFADTRIEDLWLPFFCLSSNLTTGTAMVHEAGDLVTALRASIAIPGLLPPVCTPEGILVDGGMMNNLPVDVMASRQRGPVLGVDVASDLAFQSVPARSWRGRMLRQWLRAPQETPGIAQLLLRAATVSSDAQTALTSRHAAAVLRPPLAGIDLRAWSSHATTAAIGHRHAVDQIAAGTLAPWAEEG